MRSRETSIATIVIIALVAVTTVVLGTLGGISYWNKRNQELGNVRQALVLNADQITLGLALPIWNFDHPQIDKVVEGMMRDVVLHGIEVRSADDQTVLCARGRDAQWNIRVAERELPATGLLVEKRAITFGGEKLATVTLFGTTQFAEERLRKILLWTVLNILVPDLILIGGLYLLLHRWVFKPLREVEAYAANVSTGGSAGPLPGFRGELESLCSSIGTMIGQLEARYTRLQTETKERERMTRLYAALSQVNKTIVTVNDREKLFAEICRVLVEFGKFHMAWIGWVDAKTQRVVPVAQWGNDTDYLSKISIYADDRPEGQGPTGTAIREGKSYVCNDFMHDPRTLLWRQAAEQVDFRASAVFPIRQGGAVCGAMNVYGDEPDFFRDKEIALLEEAAGDVSFALDNLAREEDRRRLERKQAELAAIVESSEDAIIGKTLAGIITSWNRGAEKVFGYSAAETIGQPMLMLFPPDRQHEEAEILARLAHGETVEHFETVRIRKGGRPINISATISPLRDGEGKVVGASKIARDITTEKRAEEALRESEARIRILGDNLPNGMMYQLDMGTDGQERRFTYVSAGVEKLHEVTAEAALRDAQVIYAQIVEADRSVVAALEAEAFAEMKPFVAEMRLQPPTGDIRWTLVASAPRRAANGHILWDGIELDITERKRAEEILREKQAQLVSAMDIAKLAHWEFDVAKNLVAADEHLFEMLGTSSAEEGGLAMPPEEYIRRFVHPADAALVASEVAMGVTAVDPNFARQFEHRFIRKDGTEGVMLIRCRTVMDAAGRLAKISGTNQDITDYKRREERFHRLVEADMHGVIFWNTRGEIHEANDAYLKIAGYTREDLAAGAVNWVALTPPEYVEQDEQALRELAATGVCKPYEKEYLRKDGSRVPVLVGGAMLNESSDEGVSFVLDLTERKKLEQQFLRAQRMESIGTLAGGIAHDLNNVLGPIMMSLELLQMKFTDPESHELLEMIRSSAQHGADMVRQVLSFARGVEGRRMELQVNHLLRDIEKIANDTFLKNIQVQTIKPHNLWTVIGDPTQVHQVLLNLCVNARDAMPSGGTLTISAENLTLDAHYAGMSPDAKPGPYVLIQVQDTGTGMPPKIVEKIFDPFFTTKEVGKGTGLGLSTTLAIVKSHGGFLQVYSEPGKGTTFRIGLPAQTETSARAVKLAPELPRGNGELILVVDDEAVVREITKQTLEAFGYRATLACDGVEAVSAYAGQGAEIALVLTDMMMPIMDGPATIEILRRMNPAVRIIGASGLSVSSQVARATSLGVKHFLPKPYTAETLLKTLQEVLSNKN